MSGPRVQSLTRLNSNEVKQITRTLQTVTSQTGDGRDRDLFTLLRYSHIFASVVREILEILPGSRPEPVTVQCVERI